MKRRILACTGLAFTVFSACSGSSSSSGSSEAGAASVGGAGTGGANVGDGGQSSSTTGATGAGGASSGIGGQTTAATTVAGTGGSGALGGSSATTGGANATGGTTTSGTGASPTGGNKASGGTTSSSSSASGGAPAGGTSGTGGTKASGGGATSTTKTSTGGGNAGGASATGGVSSTGGSSSSSTAAQHWVGTWTASPYVDTNSSNTPPITLSNSVIRQVTHVSLGGSQIRVQFSNLRGNGSVTINGAHIALCKATPAVDSTVDTTTDTALAFSGKANVTIAQGQEVWSDPVNFTVPNQGNITITTSFGTVPSTLTQHSGSRTTSYFKSGGTTADLSAANMTSATSKALWFFISGIDVMADADAKGTVAVGDSITDGRGSDTDHNNRWTDILAARLQGNAATAKVSMMNQAIGATNLAGTDNTTAQSRFNRDVLGMSGVKYVIILDGVNDIGSSGSPASTLETAYTDLITRAHGKGLLIYGGTILPFNGNSYYSTTHEQVRQDVNTWIKSSTSGFDGYIDFDAALRDPADPTKLLATYANWSQEDWLHPGPAGYQAMGNTVNLTLFTK